MADNPSDKKPSAFSVGLEDWRGRLRALIEKWREISGRPQRPTGFRLCADELEAELESLLTSAPPQEQRQDEKDAELDKAVLSTARLARHCDDLSHFDTRAIIGDLIGIVERQNYEIDSLGQILYDVERKASESAPIRSEQEPALARCNEQLNEANRDIIEMGRLLQEAKEQGRGWRCFHCGFVFVDFNEAREHFGGQSDDTPACLKPAKAKQEPAPPNWNALERFLLEQHTATSDPRYQDAATSLYQQRTGWGAPQWAAKLCPDPSVHKQEPAPTEADA